jgi:hypothetical protein
MPVPLKGGPDPKRGAVRRGQFRDRSRRLDDYVTGQIQPLKGVPRRSLQRIQFIGPEAVSPEILEAEGSGDGEHR